MDKNKKGQIVLLEQIIKSFPVAIPLRDDLARETYEGVVELARPIRNISGGGAHWEFNAGTEEIDGSNFPLLVLTNKVLGKKGLRTLTYDEGMYLDKKGELTNEVYRDFGIVVDNFGEPNSDLAEFLITDAEKRGFKLPILAHPASFDINVKGDGYIFAEDDSLIIRGEQAVEELKRFNYQGYSGVRRLVRGRDGSWSADWNRFDFSIEGGRVDWVRGTVENLEDLYKKKIEEAVAEINQRKERALAILEGKE